MSLHREAAALLADAQGPIARELADEANEDLAVNKPGEFWTRRASGWTRHVEPSLDVAARNRIVAGARSSAARAHIT